MLHVNSNVNGDSTPQGKHDRSKFRWRRNCSSGLVAVVLFLLVCSVLFMVGDLSSLRPGRLSLSALTTVQFFRDDGAVSSNGSTEAIVQDPLQRELGPEGSSENRPRVRDRAQEWVHFPTQTNETKTLLQKIAAAENGSTCCDEITTDATILGLPESTNGCCLRLATNLVHTFTILSVNGSGSPRCAGGDYYETDLSGRNWKSRPPVSDLYNGSYTVSLQVDARHPGVYVFKVVLLFRSWQGLKLDKVMHADKDSPPLPWGRKQEIVTLEIEFFSIGVDPVGGLGLEQCAAEDFRRTAWSGRWTRDNYNTSCERNAQGRFRCLPPGEVCGEPWCKGPIGELESNGWVYSAHCSFRIFSEEEAWICVNNKWWFFWGDSNFQDTVRNFLNFVLGFDLEMGWMDRRFDKVFIHPKNASRSIRITSMFNGHAVERMNYQGLSSLKDVMFNAKLRSFFTGPEVPDTVLLNSGLHDGVFWRNLYDYVEDGVETAATFWGSILEEIDPALQPNVVYRSTVAGGGNARVLDFNPQKMELYNHIIIERLRERIRNLKLVDAFDLTFPWHWDNECNDGVHYGRAPPRGREHKYFVDLMVIHIFLSAVCQV